MKLADLANALKLELHGDAAHEVSRMAPIASATANELSFVVSAQYTEQLVASRAGAVIVPPALAKHVSGNYLVSDNPYASYARASWLLTPETEPPAGIATTACIDPTATISNSASVGEHCVVGAHAMVGDSVVVGAHCILGANVSVGAHTRLFSGVTVYDDCRIGEYGRIQSGAVIGAEGFGFAYDKGWLPIHQTGRVVIGNKVHIGANTTIDRGAIEDTSIADGVLLDNQIQIAHNVRIGENTAIAGCVGIAGSTRIGANCQIGGACNIVGHLEIVDNVVLNATSYVTQSIKKPGRYGSGMPLQTNGEWKRSFVILSKLNELLKRVRRLEKHNE